MKKAIRPQPLLRDTDAPIRGRARKRRDPHQPQLTLDPMPERIEPCLALLKAKPPVGPEWAFEIKWDGYRLAVYVEAGNVRIITRGGHDWTHRFPAIAAAATDLGAATVPTLSRLMHPSSMTSESWRPIDSELSGNRNCNASVMGLCSSSPSVPKSRHQDHASVRGQHEGRHTMP
jgi:hypothetical protein